MKQKLRLFIIRNMLVLLLEMILGITLQAQQAIPAAGGTATGSSGTVTYTIGQVACQTNSGTTGIITQGVQQPYEIFVITIINQTKSLKELTDIEQAKGISLECIAYPNPTSGFLELKIEGSQFENISYQLYEINGKLLSNSKINSNVTPIPMEGLMASTYILKVISIQKEIKTFKIIKK